jgi:hypothetical protein
MDSQKKVPASSLHMDTAITANFLIIASLISVVVVTGLVCAVAAGMLVLLR